jgi:hypothetical protein
MTFLLQAALSKYEDSEFVDDRYSKIEDRLQVRQHLVAGEPRSRGSM